MDCVTRTECSVLDINDYNHPLFNGDDVNLAEGKAGKIIVAGIEFVHAEGEDTGKPMGHLPVFTPQDGIGQGEPIYDYPSTVDVSLSLIPPNVINPYRIVLLAFLDMYYYQMAETAPGSLLFTNSAASVTLLNDVLGEFGVQERISASITIPALGVTKKTLKRVCFRKICNAEGVDGLSPPVPVHDDDVCEVVDPQAVSQPLRLPVPVGGRVEAPDAGDAGVDRGYLGEHPREGQVAL